MPRLRIVRRGSVVSDMWIGENYNLARVGRIGKDLLIAGECCIENNFSRALGGRAVAFAAEDAPVFEREYGFHYFSGPWI